MKSKQHTKSTSQQNGLLVLIGAGIRGSVTDDIKHHITAKVQGLVALSDRDGKKKYQRLEAKYGTIFIQAHSGIGSVQANTPIVHGIEISDKNKFTNTCEELIKLQSKTGAKKFYLNSCYCGEAIKQIQANIERFAPETEFVFFSGRKHESIMLVAGEYLSVSSLIDKIAAGREARDIFAEAVVNYPETMIYAKKTEHGLFAIKARSPKILLASETKNIDHYLTSEYFSKPILQVDQTGKRAREAGKQPEEGSLVLLTPDPAGLAAAIHSSVMAHASRLSAEDLSHYKTEALSIAAERGISSRVDSWIKSGVDVKRKNDFGETILGGAVHKGDTASVQLLLNTEADVNATNKYGTTALMGAAVSGHAEILELLLKKKGTEINKRQVNKYSAVDFAASYGKADCVLVLMHHNADVSNFWFSSAQKAEAGSNGKKYKKLAQAIRIFQKQPLDKDGKRIISDKVKAAFTAAGAKGHLITGASDSLSAGAGDTEVRPASRSESQQSIQGPKKQRWVDYLCCRGINAEEPQRERH